MPRLYILLPRTARRKGLGNVSPKCVNTPQNRQNYTCSSTAENLIETNSWWNMSHIITFRLLVGLAASLSPPTPSYAPPQTTPAALTRAAGAPHTRAVSSEFEFKFKPDSNNVYSGHVFPTPLSLCVWPGSLLGPYTQAAHHLTFAAAHNLRLIPLPACLLQTSSAPEQKHRPEDASQKEANGHQGGGWGRGGGSG